MNTSEKCQSNNVNNTIISHENEPWRKWARSIPVSKFPNIYGNDAMMKTGGFTFEDFIDAIRQNDKEKAQAAGLGKAFKGDGDKTKEKAYNAAKLGVPAWTCAGYGQTKKTAENLTPNGVITIDIDDLTPARAIRCKEALMMIPSVMFSALSLSSCGVIAFAWFERPEICKEKEKIEDFYGLLEGFLFDYLGFKTKIDRSKSTHAALRSEFYDPTPLIRDELIAWDPRPFRVKALDAFKRSKIAKIAKLFGGGEITPQSYQVGLAFCLLSLQSGHKPIYESPYFNKSFPISAQIVGLAKSGAGKTVLNSAFCEAAEKLGVVMIQPESSRKLEEELVKTAYDEEFEEDEEQKGKKKRRWLRKEAPLKAVYVEDEAYSEQRARNNLDYKKAVEAIRRKAYDGRVLVKSSLSNPMPSETFEINYSDVRTSTEDDWADVMSNISTTAGDGRRVLEFRIPTYKEDEETPENAYLRAGRALGAQLQRMKEAPADVDAIYNEIHGLKPTKVKRVDRDLLEELQGLMEVDAMNSAAGVSSDDLIDGQTVIATLTACEAWADLCNNQYDDTEVKAERKHWLAAWAIWLGVLETRKKIRGKLTERTLTRKEEILAQVKTKLANSIESSKIKGAMRADAMERWINSSKGEEYRQALETLMRSEVLRYAQMIDGKKRYLLRMTTADEAEKMIELTGVYGFNSDDASLAVLNVPNCVELAAYASECRSLNNTEYALCSDDEKMKRAANYCAKALESASPGNRNSLGWHARVCLIKNNMYDEISKNVLGNMLESLGLDKKEIYGRNGVLR